MTTLIDFLKENAVVIGLVTTVSGAIVGGVWRIIKHFETKRENLSDLQVSPLTGPNTKRLIPLDAYGVLDEKIDNKTIFKQGLQTELVLSHNGKGKDLITISRIELVVKEFNPEFRPKKDNKIDGNAIIGAGTGKANKFTVLVYGKKVDCAIWIIDPKKGKTEQAKSENLLDVDAFNSDQGQYFCFNPQDNKAEVLQGTVITEDQGLYEMLFVYYIRVGNIDKIHETESFFVYTI